MPLTIRLYILIGLISLLVLSHQAGCLPIPARLNPDPGEGPGPGDGPAPGPGEDPGVSGSGWKDPTHICKRKQLFKGWLWIMMLTMVIVLIFLMGLIASVGIAVLSFDMTQLMVWTKTGSEKRRLVRLPGLFTAEADCCISGSMHEGSWMCDAIQIGS